MNLPELFQKTAAALKNARPIVHCITNYVTAGDAANMLLAAGASPVMADSPLETAEVAASSDALCLNMGTLSEDRLSAMLLAGKAANARNIPVILDPVGIRLSEFRKRAAAEILDAVRVSAVRANARELSFLAGIDLDNPSGGIDAAEGDFLPETARAAARRLGCVCAMTGAVDVVSDGVREIRIENGCAQLKNVTGAGCMTSALAAAFSAVSDPFCGTAFAAAFMGICGETALECSGGGMGAFRIALFDAAGMSPDLLKERLKAYEL